MYVLISQFHFTKAVVREPMDLAQLCLLASRKTAALSTFRMACVYLTLRIEFLGEGGWTCHYHLSLALYNVLQK
jgi:hypothetical protein